MLRYTGMCCPNPNAQKNPSIFIKKSLKEGPIFWKLQKTYKIAMFEVKKKPLVLGWVPNFKYFDKAVKIGKFLREKLILRYG